MSVSPSLAPLGGHPAKGKDHNQHQEFAEQDVWSGSVACGQTPQLASTYMRPMGLSSSLWPTSSLSLQIE